MGWLAEWRRRRVLRRHRIDDALWHKATSQLRFMPKGPKLRELAPSSCVCAVGRAAGGALEYRRRILQFTRGFGDIHLAERQDGVPEREPAPLALAVAHGPQLSRASAESLFPSIQTARQKISPQSHTALAAAEQPRIGPARVECGPFEGYELDPFSVFLTRTL